MTPKSDLVHAPDIQNHKLSALPASNEERMYRDLLSTLTDRQLGLLENEIAAFVQSGGVGAGLAVIFGAEAAKAA
ncbi:MAG: hypothetical protein AAGB18_06030 [Pseudomonadota bacterium]